MQFSMSGAKNVENGWSSLKTKSPGIAPIANRPSTTTEKITAAANGAHLPHPMFEISAPNSNGPKTAFRGIILCNDDLDQTKQNLTNYGDEHP